MKGRVYVIRADITTRSGETMTVHAASFEKLFEELAGVDYVSIDACNLESKKNRKTEEEYDG